MGAHRRLGQRQLVDNPPHTDPILNQIAIHLRRKMRAWIEQPQHDLKPHRAGQRGKDFGPRRNRLG